MLIWIALTFWTEGITFYTRFCKKLSIKQFRYAPIVYYGHLDMTKLQQVIPPPKKKEKKKVKILKREIIHKLNNIFFF